jgi:hypothetical protein
MTHAPTRPARLVALLCLGASGVAGASGTGTIVGRVILEGPPPAPPSAGPATDPVCGTPRLDHVVVARDGGLRDVVVRLPVGAAKPPAAPPPPALIDQQDCRYTPHVTAIVAGQKVAYRNSDATMHNVHTAVDGQTDFNIAQPRGAADAVHDVPVAPGDAPYRVGCDVHPWMSAYVLVTDHAHFAVTGEDGRFRLENVPAGSYKLQAWHPHLGARTLEVKVARGKSFSVRFTFPAYNAADRGKGLNKVSE